MRKSVYLLAVMFAIATACSKEVAETPYYGEDVNTNAPVFKAGINTKATLEVVNSTTAKVNWANGDGLTIWNGTQTAAYSTTDSGSSAIFTTGDEFSAAANYVAIYPADGSAAFSAGSVTTTLPAAQTAVAGTFDPAASIAVATSTSTSLSFNNLVTYVQFTVPAGMDDLTSVSFKGNAGEKVAGAVTIDTTTPALTATGSATATLSGSFTEGETYYLAVAPGNYASGYTLEITRGSNVYKLKSTKDVTFVRSNSRNIGILWDGTVSMEGAASGAMTRIGNANVTASIQETVFTYRGVLSSGTLKIKLGGINTYAVQDINIPSDGDYHVMYNATTGRVRVYSEDVCIHLGANAPVSGYKDTDYLGNNNDISFGLNQFLEAKTPGQELTDLVNYNNIPTSLAIKSSDSNTTMSDYNNTYNSNKITCSYYVDDDFYPSYGFFKHVLIQSADQNTDSVEESFVISGLDNLAQYDVRVASARWGGSFGSRVTDITIGANTVSVPSALTINADPVKGYSATTNVVFRKNIAYFDAVSPVSNKITVTMQGKATGVSGTNGDGNLGFIYISKVVYSKN